MKFLTAISPFIVTVSGLIEDLYLHTNNDCGGSSLVCSKFPPNTCCGTSTNNSPYQSVALRGSNIQNLKLQLRGYDGGNCKTLKTISGNNGNPWICNRSNGFRYTGCGYNPVSRKRAASELNTECQRPDALVLPDGTKYDLTGLNDDDFASIVNISVEATKPADIPQRFQTLEIK
ncbi:hypothetical protein NW762_010323 [Fusarium torreyae]|uniref:Uncharacterized protein n=1 Tax=Fusarium torreyae TaxID=1237075 RepID=A0A9W8RU48_9HYPO|nr:hypothetical protein NW762_010323 [Fusarium torreyae]